MYSIGYKNVTMGTTKTLKKQFTTQANVSLFLAHFLQNELVMQSMSPVFYLGFVREGANRLSLISNICSGNVTMRFPLDSAWFRLCLFLYYIPEHATLALRDFYDSSVPSTQVQGSVDGTLTLFH